MREIIKITVIFCVLFCLSQTALAASYAVTKTDDTNDGACDADCSLREAIAAANATADNDLVTFSLNLFNAPQTIVLTGGDLIINNNGSLTITGPGANFLTVSGNNANRVFTNNTGAVTAINFLRVTGGNGISTITATNGRGGGIYNNGGNLTLNGLIVTGNTTINPTFNNGGGLSNGSNGTMTILNSLVSNNVTIGSGGGMQNFSNSTVNILNTTFTGNVSNSDTVGGGAIQANGTLNIANSTFSGNTAAAGSGGAIFYNSTIAGNILTMNNVTIVNNRAAINGGGVYKSTGNALNLRNNIIANNAGGDSPDIFGVVASQGNNLIGNIGSSSGYVASDLLNRNPLLAPLAANSLTVRTHALLPNSPAVDAGNNCVVNASCSSANPFQPLQTDQRGSGFARQFGANADIGAFEVNAVCACANRTPLDFDGDGRTDYAVFRPSNSVWYLQRSSAGFFAAQFGVASDRLTPADFDGDGRTDIAVWREVSPSFSYFFILNSSDNTFRAEQFGVPGDDPRVVGDWDGDGRADLAVFRNAVGIPENPAPTYFFYRASGAPGAPLRAVQWGNIFDRAVRGDFDADGRQDAAVFRPSDRVWYILQSSNNQPLYLRWGAPDDRLVPADYDADGRTDAAIYRNGLWAILPSSTLQPIYQNWGLATDRPTPGDYDGDARADFAVWRDGTFFALRNNGSNQFSALQFGTTNDVPVASALVP